MAIYNHKIDFIKDIPSEIFQVILAKLDTKSLLNAAQVSRKWLSVCKSTATFRQCIRIYAEPANYPTYYHLQLSITRR